MWLQEKKSNRVVVREYGRDGLPKEHLNCVGLNLLEKWNIILTNYITNICYNFQVHSINIYKLKNCWYLTINYY